MPNKPKLVWSICQTCKKPFRTTASDLRKGQYNCSRKCAAISAAHKNRGKIRPELSGPLNPNWRGGITRHCKGYIYQYAPHHPRQWNGYVLQHILVAEDKLGRYLLPGEVVHHHNGNKADNRPENIAVFSSPGEHSKYHHKIRKEVQYAN